MAIDIVAGTVMMRTGALLPRGMNLMTHSYSKTWDVVAEVDGFSMDRSLRAAGWNFFFTAGALRAATFGRREGKNARQAVDRILSKVQAQNFNSVEITEISTKHFLGIPYMSVCAHARQIQSKNQTLQDCSGRREAQRLADEARN
jgi:hypothetical protein